ncbi:MAG TPA: hypothetical protein VJA17_00185, partial [Candidatus Omnitrophota bacterium]|nr:hypothetical protein [Candidatus Omnitrophota bacterium]
MKKIIKQFYKNLRPVRLYLEDLVEIENILRSVSDNIEISTEEHELENLLEDVKSLNKDHINSLRFWCRNPCIALDFDKNSISVYVSDQDDLKAMG